MLLSPSTQMNQRGLVMSVLTLLKQQIVEKAKLTYRLPVKSRFIG